MNAQEIFDKAVGGVLRQGALSVTHERGYASCEYRCVVSSKITLKCPIGHLIEDNEYSLEMENLHIGYSYERLVIIAPSLQQYRKQHALLIHLQDIHDGASKMDKPMACFKRLCKDYAADNGIKWNFDEDLLQ